MTSQATGHQFTQGTHYQILSPRVETDAELTLFFSPACPHCRTLELIMEEWLASQAVTPSYERIPVQFGRDSWALLSRIYATGVVLEAEDKLVAKLFSCLQNQRSSCLLLSESNLKLETLLQWISDATSRERAQVADAWRSDQTDQLHSYYASAEQAQKVQSVPMLVVKGEYKINQSSFDSWDEVFELVELLLEPKSQAN